VCHDCGATKNKMAFMVVFVRSYDGRETLYCEEVRANQFFTRLDDILCDLRNRRSMRQKGIL